MAIVPISTLKSYYLTGSKPTQSNYNDLIDTLNASGGTTSIVYNVQDYGASAGATVSANQAIFESLVSSSNLSGIPVYVPSVGSGSYYNLNGKLRLRQYGSIYGDGPGSQLKFNMATSAYSCFETDCYKNAGNIIGLGIYTDSGVNLSQASAVAIQIGAGKGSQPSINANPCVRIAYNYFGDGFYDQIYCNQECDNSQIHNNISFSNVGRSRIFYSIGASNREAPGAGIKIYQNHFSQPTVSAGYNQYGIYICGTDAVMLEQNIVNNHNVNYFLDSPSDASMRENTSPILIGNYSEEQRAFVSASPRWSSGITPAVGSTYRPTKANANGLIAYASAVTGPTGSSEPAWGAGGNDNFGPTLSVSKITDGGVTWAMRYASIGFCVTGQNRRARIMNSITKGLIGAYVARGGTRINIENHDVVVITPDHDLFYGISGFQQVQGFCKITDSNVRGNIRPYRLSATDTLQHCITMSKTIVGSGTDSIGIFPTSGTGDYQNTSTSITYSVNSSGGILGNNLSVTGQTTPQYGINNYNGNGLGFYWGGSRGALIPSGGGMIVGGFSDALLTAAGSVNPELQLAGDNTNDVSTGLFRYGDDNGQGTLAFAKSRSTFAFGHTAVSAGDVIGSLDISGSDGTDFRYSAQVRFGVDAPVASNSVPGNIQLLTTASGSTTPTERMRIDNRGNVVLGGSAVTSAATGGFVYIPTVPGSPSGTPTTYTGRVAMLYDTQGNRLWIYNGSWRSVALT